MIRLLKICLKDTMGLTVRFLVFVAVLYCSNSAKVLDKIVVDDPSALCLDGSPAAYYLHQGKDRTKFILSFEGGGWCGSGAGVNQTIDACYQRSKTKAGSSTTYNSTISFDEGLMSDSPNNIFSTWTVIHLKYCDGTGHQGYRKDPLAYKSTKLYFRGHNITIAQLNSIDKKYKLFTEATDILVTGQSAGGLAAISWTNYIVGRAPKKAKVWSFIDSGIFLDLPNIVTHKNDYKQSILNFMELSNKEIDPPTAECVKANGKQKWKCMFTEYLYEYVSVPLFVAQSLYDPWCLPNILGISCIDGGVLSSCSKDLIKQIQVYKQKTSALVKKIGSRAQNGGWAISCSYHVFSTRIQFYSSSYRVPANSNSSIQFGVQQWMSGKSANNLYIDNVLWPNNGLCSGKVSLKA